MVSFALIHGSTQNASCWDLMRPHLEGAGHEVIAIELPADRPDFTATDFARVAADQMADDTVVVAHSASGILLPLIAQLRPVRAIVYLAAMIPARGLTPLEQFEREPEMLHTDWAQAGRQWSREVAERFLFHDVVFSTREWAHSTVRLMRIDGMLRERFSGSSITPVPALCIVCGRDRTINSEWQERVWRERTDSMFRMIDAGHCPHISTPRETAHRVLFAADPPSMQRINAKERAFMLQGRMTPRPHRGPFHDRVSYDEFMAVECRARHGLFFALTPQNKAEIVRTHVARWLDENRSRLIPEQITIMEENISFIQPHFYEDLRRTEDQTRLDVLIGRMYALFTREEMYEALSWRGG